MLQEIRDKLTGWTAKLVLGAIAIVFIFWGINLGDTAGANYAAKVNGQPIAIETVRNAWRDQQLRLQQMFQGEIPEAMLKSQQQALLDQHIQRQLLSERAADMGYSVSMDTVSNFIASAPELQVDGRFDRMRYAELLRQQGRTAPQFERELRSGMQIEQLQSGIVGSSFVTPSELTRRHALQNQQRDVDYVVIPFAPYLASAKITDADVQAWYDAHKSDYMTEETVDLEYIELKLTDIESSIAVTDDALRDYYEQVKERFVTPERRMARHILFSAGATPEADAAAQAAAADVLAKLKAGGDFATLAKAHSKDPGSAEKGGDLGWATRGTFVGPFEDALFAMSKGELRGPIKTQFGYHIIRLDDVEGGQTTSFDSVRAELEVDFRKDKAQSVFYEKSQKIADEAFASLTELATVATGAGLPLKKAPGFTRGGGEPFGAEPKIIEAAFKLEALEKGENSSMLGLGDDRAVVLRVAGHAPAKELPLASVRAKIESALRERSAKEAAALRGAELMAKLQAGAAWTSALAELKLTAKGKRTIDRNDKDMPAPIRAVAFDIPRASISASATPAFRSATVDQGDYAVLAVSEVYAPPLNTGEPDAADKLREAVQAQGANEFAAYLADVEGRAKIVRNPIVFE